ncbi:MAG: hypothetical protein ACRBCI_00185 [Cellvibrionaceae bacterium]
MKLVFESEVKANPETVWNWIASGAGIEKEISPIIRMSSLAAIEPSKIGQVVLGEPLVRSWIWLFGFIPIGYSDLTLIEINQGKGFLEKSPMSNMCNWEHERRMEVVESGSIIKDILIFEPRFLPKISCMFINFLFNHRHKKLVKYLGYP